MATDVEREETTKRMKSEITEGLRGGVETIERHGAYLLNAFTNDLYTDFAQACKEYISNSVDARANEVRIRCQSPNYHTLTIFDNGDGMSKDQLFSALDVMVSKKRGDYDEEYPMIGRFGVGIYAGALLCETIHIASKRSDSNEVNTVRIPIGRWLQAAENPELELTQVTHFTHEEEDAISEEIDNSYTIVTLEDLKPRVIKMLKKDKARGFIEELSRILPVEFDGNLKLKATSIPDGKEKEWDFIKWLTPVLDGSKYGQKPVCQYNNARVYFNGKQIYRPAPVTNPISDVQQVDKAFYIDVEGRKELAGIGWALARGPRIKRNKEVEKFGTYKETAFRGVQVRLFNVGIFMHATTYAKVGVKTQSQPAGNWWGEIYLFHPDLKLLLTRTDFVNNDVWLQLQKQISDWLKELLRNVENARKLERERVEKQKKKEEQEDAKKPEERTTADDESDIEADETGVGSGEIPLNSDQDFDTSWIEELKERFSLSDREENLLMEFQNIILEISKPINMEDDMISKIVKVLEDHQMESKEEHSMLAKTSATID